MVDKSDGTTIMFDIWDVDAEVERMKIIYKDKAAEFYNKLMLFKNGFKN